MSPNAQQPLRHYSVGKTKYEFCLYSTGTPRATTTRWSNMLPVLRNYSIGIVPRQSISAADPGKAAALAASPAVLMVQPTEYCFTTHTSEVIQAMLGLRN